MTAKKKDFFTPLEGDGTRMINAKLLHDALKLAVPLMALTGPTPPPEHEETLSEFEQLFYSSPRGVEAVQEYEDFKKQFAESSKWIEPLANRAQLAVARKDYLVQLSEIESKICVIVVLQTLRASKRNLEAKRIANELELAIRNF